MGGSEPYLTVLALTWKRTKYLREALTSALHQTLDRSQYEVILSKGVPDPELEAYCRAEGVTVLFEESWDLGRRIDLALDTCRGEVIVPLEDDDEFEPNKLEAIAEQFRGNPELVYFHNAFRAIGERGEPLDDLGFRRHTLHRLAESGSVYSATGNPLQRLEELEKLDPSWNTSSIAFRRSLLEGRREVLRQLAFLADRWIYLCALVDRKAVLIDQRPMTRYRLHRANTSGVGGRGIHGGSAVPELVERVRSISDRQLHDFEVVREALRGAGEMGLASSIDDKLPLLRFLSALRSPRPTRRAILARFLELLHHGKGAASSSPWAGRLTSTLVLYALTPLFVLSPRWGATGYVYLRELPRR